MLAIWILKTTVVVQKTSVHWFQFGIRKYSDIQYICTHIPNISDLSSITSRFAPKAAPIVYQNKGHTHVSKTYDSEYIHSN